MEFEDYARKVNSVKEIETFGHLLNEKQKQIGLQLKIIEEFFKKSKNQKNLLK